MSTITTINLPQNEDGTPVVHHDIGEITDYLYDNHLLEEIP